MMNSKNVYHYCIDKNDVIISVSDNWAEFAQENYGTCGCLHSTILGSTIWDHIADIETRHLYEIILKKVRNRKNRAKFSFRCDSPDERRFLTLSVEPLTNGAIHFISKLIRKEARERVNLLRADVTRSNEHIRICSMCKRIVVAEEKWVEVEVAVEQMQLFSLTHLPKLTHGVCPTCLEAALLELDKL